MSIFLEMESILGHKPCFNKLELEMMILILTKLADHLLRLWDTYSDWKRKRPVYLDPIIWSEDLQSLHSLMIFLQLVIIAASTKKCGLRELVLHLVATHDKSVNSLHMLASLSLYYTSLMLWDVMM